MLNIPIKAELTVVDGESLRTRITQFRAGGKLTEPAPYTDLRGAPIGDQVQTWKWDRMVLPHKRAQRRVRELLTAEFCPEGWHCVSGGNDRPMEGGATCNTIIGSGWADRHAFNRYHAEHPVVWRVTVKRGRNTRVIRFCDPELPDEFRVDPDANPCTDCHLLVPFDATSYAVDSGGVCGPCGIKRYGANAGEYLIALGAAG